MFVGFPPQFQISASLNNTHFFLPDVPGLKLPMTTKDLKIMTTIDLKIMTTKNLKIMTTKNLTILTTKDLKFTSTKDITITRIKDLTITTTKDLTICQMTTRIIPHVIFLSLMFGRMKFVNSCIAMV